MAKPLFKIPAFKIHPGLFLRLSRQMSSTAANPIQADRLPRATFYPVTLSFQEGFQVLPMLLNQLSDRRARLFRDLPPASLKPHKVKLLFVPFVNRGSDLVQPEQNIGVQKNALSVGRLL